MKQAVFLALVGALALAGCAGSPQRSVRDQIIDRALHGAPGQAQPSTIVTTELAFARLAQEKGQWTAFAQYAADGALMFEPGPVDAKAWLKGRANPPQSVAWQPHQVWMSCDGSLAVSKGAWQRPDGSNGYFTTVWQRQKDGKYLWVMDQGDVLAEPLAEPDFIQTQVADCTRDAAPPLTVPIAQGYDARGGTSHDKSLVWNVAIAPDAKTRFVSVYLLHDGQFERVLQKTVRNAR